MISEENLQWLTRSIKKLRCLEADPLIALALQLKPRQEQLSNIPSDSLEERKQIQTEIVSFFNEKLEGILSGHQVGDIFSPVSSTNKGIILPITSQQQTSNIVTNRVHEDYLTPKQSSSSYQQDYGLLPKFRQALDAILGPQLKPTKSRFRDCLCILQIVQNNPQITYQHSEGGMILGVPSSNLIDCVKCLLNAGFKNTDQKLLNSIKSGRVVPQTVKSVPGLHQLIVALTKSYLGSHVIKDQCIRAYFEFCRQNHHIVPTGKHINNHTNSDAKTNRNTSITPPNSSAQIPGHKRWLNIVR